MSAIDSFLVTLNSILWHDSILFLLLALTLPEPLEEGVAEYSSL